MAQLIIEYYGPRFGQEYDEWKSEIWTRVRSHRDFLIKETDWMLVADAPISAELKSKYTEYRQALRDLPQSTDNPDEIVWPVKPE